MLKTFSDIYCKKKSLMVFHKSPKNSITGLKKYSISDKTLNINIMLPLNIVLHGGIGEVVNTPDCGSGMRGFDPHISPHKWIITFLM